MFCVSLLYVHLSSALFIYDNYINEHKCLNVVLF